MRGPRSILGRWGGRHGASTGQPQTTFQPVGTMRQLMIDIIYPTSDAIFYVDRDTPKTAQDWDVLRTEALTLAESGKSADDGWPGARSEELDHGIEDADRHRRESVQGGAGQGYRRDSRAQ